MRRVPQALSTAGAWLARFATCLALALVCIGANGRAYGVDAPVPPCAGAPAPVAAGPGAPAVVALLFEDNAAAWVPPTCLGWQAAKPNLLIAEAARFLNPDGAAGVLARFAAVSGFTQARYWSAARGSYRPLIRTAFALEKSDKGARRGDFGEHDLAEGASRFVALGNTGASVLVYRLDVKERTQDRVTVMIENVADAHFLIFPVLPARGVQCTFTFEREDGDVWRYYALFRISGVLRPFARSAQSSFSETAQALLSYFGGTLPPPETAVPPAR